MNSPLINILVRTSYRPTAFQKMLQSIKKQSYKNINILISYDDERALDYIPQDLYHNAIRVYKSNDLFWYDNYCDELGDCDGIICQMRRRRKLKPPDMHIKTREIMQGQIGMPCLVLNSKYKNLLKFDGSVPAADYNWIKGMSQMVKLNFCKIVLVSCNERDYGKMEE